MSDAVIWLVHRLRPPRGWIAFVLTLGALLSLPLAVMQAAKEWRPPAALGGLEPVASELLILSTLAVIVSLVAGQGRLAERAGWILGTFGGLALALVLAGHLLPPWSLITADLRSALLWLRAWQGRVVAWPFPFAGTVGYSWQQLSALAEQVVWDVQSVLRSGRFWDTITYHLLGMWIAWFLAYVAVWFMYRRQRVLVGLLPSGILLSLVVFVYREAAIYLIIYLFCALWLEAMSHLWQRKARWENRGIDYPDGLGVELVFTAAPWIMAAILLASFFPTRGFWRVSHAIWDGVEQVFGPIEGEYGSGPPQYGGMPQTHLLGGGPELLETVVMYVTTDDPRPPQVEPQGGEAPAPQLPARYWRGETFDIYTGHGWASSPVEPRTIDRSEPLIDRPPGRDELRQAFELVVPARAVTYAANAPLQLDRPVQAWWRGPEDLAWLSHAADRYEVISIPPEPSVDDLRAAAEELPFDLADRYLALPDSLPTRVLDLAAEVAEGADTRYDQARALETFLRTYTYTLDIPAPPTDHDVVDHFLFELQEGYCDYYASAMVVMARAVGVPARFATGYAQGTFDHDAGRWVVTEKDGHSWAEIYFEGIGWVEFEPTSGLPALDRPRDSFGRARPTVPPIPPRAGQWWDRVPWVLLVWVGLVTLLAAFVAWIWFRRRQPITAAELVRNRHQRLVHWGDRLGTPLRDGQTAQEYGAALSAALSARGSASRWSTVRQASDDAPDGIRELTAAYVRAQYSPEPVSGREGWRIRERWQQLKRQLWWLWLASGPEPTEKDGRDD
ncbi:MAG: transglutaminaseTgpA domain-containing protein [Anaerolineae bacterium]